MIGDNNQNNPVTLSPQLEYHTLSVSLCSVLTYDCTSKSSPRKITMLNILHSFLCIITDKISIWYRHLKAPVKLHKAEFQRSIFINDTETHGVLLPPHLGLLLRGSIMFTGCPEGSYKFVHCIWEQMCKACSCTHGSVMVHFLLASVSLDTCY